MRRHETSTNSLAGVFFSRWRLVFLSSTSCHVPIPRGNLRPHTRFLPRSRSTVRRSRELDRRRVLLTTAAREVVTGASAVSEEDDL